MAIETKQIARNLKTVSIQEEDLAELKKLKRKGETLPVVLHRILSEATNEQI